jgi:hypothetical protein
MYKLIVLQSISVVILPKKKILKRNMDRSEEGTKDEQRQVKATIRSLPGLTSRYMQVWDQFIDVY